jgi:hypothetical protein
MAFTSTSAEVEVRRDLLKLSYLKVWELQDVRNDLIAL